MDTHTCDLTFSCVNKLIRSLTDSVRDSADLREQQVDTMGILDAFSHFFQAVSLLHRAQLELIDPALQNMNGSRR